MTSLGVLIRVSYKRFATAWQRLWGGRRGVAAAILPRMRGFPEMDRVLAVTRLLQSAVCLCDILGWGGGGGGVKNKKIP
jgi:hypothetical protein